MALFLDTCHSCILLFETPLIAFRWPGGGGRESGDGVSGVLSGYMLYSVN